MTTYLLSIIQPVGDPPPPEVLGPIMREVTAVQEEMQRAGAWVFAGGLHGPESATMVRVRDGEVSMTDGPWVESKEHLGGFTVVRAADLDEALEWARKLASAVTLPIEVRPFQHSA